MRYKLYDWNCDLDQVIKAWQDEWGLTIVPEGDNWYRVTGDRELEWKEFYGYSHEEEWVARISCKSPMTRSSTG